MPFGHPCKYTVILLLAHCLCYNPVVIVGVKHDNPYLGLLFVQVSHVDLHTLIQLFTREEGVDQFVGVWKCANLPLEVIFKFEFEQVEVILVVVYNAMVVLHFVFDEDVTYCGVVEYFALFF